jgi:hypothetical protein
MNETMKQYTSELSRGFSNEEIQVVKIKLVEGCSASLATKEMQMKSTLRLYLTPI